MQPTIYFASDHAGFTLKNELVVFVRDVLGYTIVDCGADSLNEGDDFTDFVAKAAREVSSNPDGAKAIILGGSGQGEAMLANRFDNVRAVVYYASNEEIIRLSRVHNDANVLSLGARFLSTAEAQKAVMLWLQIVHVPVEKYDRRIEEIESFAESDSGVVVQNNPVPNILPVSFVPSLPAASFAEIAALLDTLEGACSGIQIDIVDGVFAPFISWPFSEPDFAFSLGRLDSYRDFEIEIDCMCMNPEQYLDLFVSLGVARVVIHEGSTTNYEMCIAHSKKHGYKIGFAIRNTSPRSFIDTYIAELDFVQVMGIEHIGKQGQPFDERTLETVSTLRSAYPSLEIAVDGGVNEVTIPLLLHAGANRLAPGSAIAKVTDPLVAYKQLASIIGL